MESVETKTAGIKQRLAKGRVAPVKPLVSSNPFMRERRILVGIGLLLFLVFAGMSARYEIVRGSFTSLYFWPRLLAASLLAFFSSLAVYPQYPADDSKPEDYLPFWKSLTTVPSIGRVGGSVLVGALIFLIPMTGAFRTANAVLGSSQPIEIDGEILSIDDEPYVIHAFAGRTYNRYEYKVITVRNEVDGQNYRVDVRRENFDHWRLAIGQRWKDQIFDGALGLRFRIGNHVQ